MDESNGGTAAEVRGKYQPEKAAVALASDGQSPREFLETLLAASERAEARRFLAHALPVREAIWWAVQAVASVSDPADPEEQGAASERGANLGCGADGRASSRRRVGRGRKGRVG